MLVTAMAVWTGTKAKAAGIQFAMLRAGYGIMEVNT